VRIRSAESGFAGSNERSREAEPGRSAWLAVLCLILLGCSGQILVPQIARSTTETEPRCEVSSGRVTARRLSRNEYNNTMRDLFNFDTGRPADTFPADVSGGDAQNNSGLTVTDLFFEKHEATVADLSSRAIEKGFIRCDPSNVEKRLCARQTLAPFMRRAWRRAVTEDEIQVVLAYLDVVAAEPTEPQPFRQAIALGIQDILMSPNFLFRFEMLDKPNEAQAQKLSGYELASRLSYFIFESTPDDGLLTAAETGALEDPSQLESQVQRMLSDPKAQALVDRLAEDWLWANKVDVLNPKAARYPNFDADMRQSLKHETALYLREFVLGENRFSDIWDSKFSFVNQRLAAHYNLPNAGLTQNFSRISLEADDTRGGLLTQGAILAATSAPLNNPKAEVSETNVIVRGKFVLQQLLCSTIEVPAGIDFVAIQNAAQQNIPKNAPRKQRDAVRQARPECASCHSVLDPIGFSMEHFDLVGASRNVDSFGAAVDSTGVLKGLDGTVVGSFDGARTLGTLMKNDARVSACATRAVLQAAVGRSLQAIDECRVKRLVPQESNGGRLRDLVLAITRDNAFTQQEGEP
jgi:Protein of unknown function (DUF1592)/Protein of unknown function (DUF1588)/Protein of unknown function (DUF1595)/Protein of unknown function (DUF1587)/Protein of unknown function (DUF1585)